MIYVISSMAAMLFLALVLHVELRRMTTRAKYYEAEYHKTLAQVTVFELRDKQLFSSRSFTLAYVVGKEMVAVKLSSDLFKGPEKINLMRLSFGDAANTLERNLNAKYKDDKK